MVIKRFIILFFILSSLSCFTKAQEETITNTVKVTLIKQPDNLPDTIPLIELEEPELNTIISLREQFEKQNRMYSTPVTPNENLLRFLNKDEVTLSDEALYWAHWVRDASTLFDNRVTFRDTIITNPLFLPIVFKGKLLPDNQSYYDEQAWMNKIDIPQPFTAEPLFKEQTLRNDIENKLHRYVETNHPEYFRYSLRDLPQDKVIAEVIKKPTYQPDMIKVESEADFSDVDAPVKFIPERRYWTSHFESAIQFAQNYISPNWHKGGVSALNLTNRQYFVYNYNKDKTQFSNELEWKTNVYTAPKDTLRDYKIGDDVLRLHSNIGYKAFSKWFYTFDATVQTQLFTNYAENTENKLAGILAPLKVNIGLGMKYDLNKTFAKKRHKNLTLAANIAPLSYNFMYSIDKEMDLGRHGFKKDETTGEFNNKLNQFGSTINATLNFQFNRNVSWYSRFYYFTSYKRIEGEFENRLNMAISRFFSTTITLNLRYDDAVSKREDFDSFLQINELFSFGFNYKW